MWMTTCVDKTSLWVVVSVVSSCFLISLRLIGDGSDSKTMNAEIGEKNVIKHVITWFF